MQDEASLLALIDQMLWTTALIAGPILIAALGIGLVIGIIQAATSVNEQTLTFVPKLAIVAAVLVLMGGSMMVILTDFLDEIFLQIGVIAR
jgi:flagellar biosynthetic protein FliQ